MSISDKDKHKSCPFCGGFAQLREDKRWGFEDFRIQQSPPYLTMGVTKTDKIQNYFYCENCNKKFVFVNQDIKSIIENIDSPNEVSAKYIADCVSFYYKNKITLRELLEKYSVGIVRSYKSRLSYISEEKAKKTLYICFNYNNIRTFATISREKNNQNIMCYTIKTLEVP